MEKRLAQGESVPSFVFQKSLLQTQIFRKISNEALYQNKRDLIKRTKKKNQANNSIAESKTSCLESRKPALN
jgi:hypothetical protein